MGTAWLSMEAGAKDFFDTYLETLEPLNVQLEREIADHPVFGPLLAATPAQVREQNARDSRARVERAFSGDWNFYEQSLKREGTTYAGLGITFPDWYHLATVWARALVPILVRRFASEPERLAAVLITMHSFLGRSMGALGDAFLDESSRRLRRNEEELATTLHCIGDGVIATDAEGRITRMNPAAAALTGANSNEAMGKPLPDVLRLSPDEETSAPTSGAMHLASASGKTIPILCSRAPLMHVGHEASGEVLVFRDVSAVRARERELVRWEALFQRVGWGIAITDDMGSTIEMANPAFAEMYAVSVADVRGKAVAELYAPGAFEEVVGEHRAYAQDTGHASFESMHRRANGLLFPVRVEAARIPGLAGSNVWVLSIHDLSERNQVEVLRAHSHELELENRRVQEASRLKSEFLANMSHELRTPLNSILGFASLLVDGEVGPLEERQREFIGDIHSSGRHLLRLINDVLDLSKIEAGRMEFHPEPVNASELVMEVTGVLRGIALDKGIEPTVEVDPLLGELHLDAGRLKQVLYNFLSNAIKFTPRGGTVGVRLLAEGASVRIEVFDTGPGISERDIKRLFREFEQLDSGRTKAHSGTGLGLALTRGLVEAQGGIVGVTSDVGRGSTFYALLPRRSASRTTLPQPRSIPGPRLSAPRVLVIEDDAADQERIVNTLVGAGYAVDTATTGAQAQRACAKCSFEAITLDLLLPDMSGLDVLGHIRGSARSKNTPVIVVSVVTEKVTGGFLVHDVLPKPLNQVALVDSLARAGIRAPTPGAILVIDDDEASARLMVVSLQQMGLRAVVAADGEQGLAAARSERPLAVVLDLVMPNLDGFGFLEQFRREVDWDPIPVLVWSVRDLSHDDHRTLMTRAAAVIPKNGSGARSLVDILRRHVPAGSGGQ